MTLFIDRERFLVKPFSLDTLSTQVEEIIRGDQEKTLAGGTKSHRPTTRGTSTELPRQDSNLRPAG
jgi:hypothetical protein